MKITKSQLTRIIKEELSSVLNEGDDWYDDEYETLADRKFARDEAGEWPGVESPGDEVGEWPGVTDPNPADQKDNEQELAAGLDLAGFELTKDRGYYFIVDKESGERVLGPFRTEGQAEERATRSDTRSEFETSQEVLSKLGR